MPMDDGPTFVTSWSRGVQDAKISWIMQSRSLQDQVAAHFYSEGSKKLLHCGSSMLQDAVLMVSPSRTRGSYSISSAAKTLQKIFVGLSSFTAGLIMPCTALHVLLAHCASADASNPPA